MIKVIDQVSEMFFKFCIQLIFQFDDASIELIFKLLQGEKELGDFLGFDVFELLQQWHWVKLFGSLG